MPDINRMCQEAAELADRYNWPEQARLLRQGIVPDGFGTEVGKAVALFMAPPIIVIGCRRKAEEEREQNRQHGRALAHLRMLLARIRLARAEQWRAEKS